MTISILTVPELAKLMGVAPSTLRDRRLMWEAGAGFPPPLPLPGRLRWDAEAIEIWLQTHRPPHMRTRALPNADDGGDASPEAVVARRLAARRLDKPVD